MAPKRKAKKEEEEIIICWSEMMELSDNVDDTCDSKFPPNESTNPKGKEVAKGKTKIDVKSRKRKTKTKGAPKKKIAGSSAQESIPTKRVLTEAQYYARLEREISKENWARDSDEEHRGEEKFDNPHYGSSDSNPDSDAYRRKSSDDW